MQVTIDSEIERTRHLRLPYMMPMQRQKNVTFNEALLALDALVQPAIASRNLNEPPSEVEDGARFILGEAPTGEWAAATPGAIAAWQDGAWRFHEAQPGWLAWVLDEGLLFVRGEDGWSGAGTGGIAEGSVASLAALGIGTEADPNNALSVRGGSTLLTHANGNGDHRLTLNKAAVADTASLVFQTGYGGRAEMGLAGGDDWAIKVSGDGAEWCEAIVVERATGKVRFPHGIQPERTAPGLAGGTAIDGPPDPMTLVLGTGDVTLEAGRLHLSPFFVEAPVRMLGGTIARIAPSAQGAVLRAAIVRLGSRSAAGWALGEEVAALGTAQADETGHHAFLAPTPATIGPGWYAMIIGCDADGAALRALRYFTPDLSQVTPSGEGAQCGWAGLGPHLVLDGQGAAIANGYPTDWSGATASGAALDGSSDGFHIDMLVVPRWEPA